MSKMLSEKENDSKIKLQSFKMVRKSFTFDPSLNISSLSSCVSELQLDLTFRQFPLIYNH